MPAPPHAKGKRIIAGSLKDVGAMRAEADDVLQEHLIIEACRATSRVVLQAEAAEFAGIVFEHRAGPARRRALRVDRAAGETPGCLLPFTWS